jgi:uncharacterized lipoprotein NlpE involved in copper resistance
MHKKAFFYFALMAASLAAALCGCYSKYPPDIRNSRISVDWTGNYFGVLPDAVDGGPVIYAYITLNNDQTFELQYQYLGRSDDVFTDKGTFSWDESGGIIELYFGYMDLPPYYRVGENRLIMLEMDAKTIKGMLGDNYVLRKAL